MGRHRQEGCAGYVEMLRAALESCRAPRAAGAEVTHTAFDGGRYYIPAACQASFFRAYAAALAEGEMLGIVEQHRHIAPVVIDLDLRGAAGPDGRPRRLYAPEDVAAFVAALHAALAELVDMRGVACTDTYVLEKPPRVKAGGGGNGGGGAPVVKDGLHIVIPEVVTRAETQLLLRQAMLPAVERLFGNRGAAGDVYDEAVIERNGWPMLGSRKKDAGGWEENAWAISRVFFYDAAASATAEAPRAAVEAIAPADRPPSAALVALLSIRNKHVEAPLTEPGRARVMELVERREAERQARIQAECEAHARATGAFGAAARAEGGGEEGGGGDCDGDALAATGALGALVALLGPERAVPWYEWYKVGQCLANVTDKSEQGLELFHAFSKRADEADARSDEQARALDALAGGGGCGGDDAAAAPQDEPPRAGRYDARACDQLWRSLTPTAGPGKRLGVGSLRHWAREDDPDGYRAWAAAHGRRAAPQAPVDAEAQRQIDRVASVLKERLSPVDGPLDIRAEVTPDHQMVFTAFRDGADGDGEAAAAAKGRVSPHYFVTLEKPVPRFLGPLVPGTVIDTQLKAVHHALNKPRGGYVCVMSGDDTMTLVPSDPAERESGTLGRVTMFKPFSGAADAYANLQVPGKGDVGLSIKKVQVLEQVVRNAVQEYTDRVLGVNASIVFANCTFNNNLTIVVPPNGDKDRPQALTQEEVVDALVRGAPELCSRIAFCPEAKTGCCNGIFFCDPDTSIWKREANEVLEQRVLAAIRPLEAGLARADVRHIHSVRGRADTLYALKSRCIVGDFLLRANSDPNLFAFADGQVYDLTVRAFRRAQPRDYIVMHVPWAYDPAAAAAHRPAVDRFLAQVLPDADERRVAITFFALLLSGRRELKRFAIFTDRRDGNNGKSTFWAMLKQFFGAYAICKTEFFLKGSFEKSRDSHDAGLQAMIGKRLAVADEMSNEMWLDAPMIKKGSGGPAVRMQGRGMRTADVFEFTWQAGMLLIFNNGQCPKFDASDAALCERMLIVPFRAKFVAGQQEERVDRHDGPEFPLDQAVDQRFGDWMPALFDVFVDHLQYAPLLMDSRRLPKSMTEWRTDIASDANVLKDWLERSYEATGDDADYVELKDAKDAFFKHEADGGGSNDEKRRVPRKQFINLAKAYFVAAASAGSRAVYNEYDSNVPGKPTTRAVVRGLKPRPPAFAARFTTPDEA